MRLQRSPQKQTQKQWLRQHHDVISKARESAEATAKTELATKAAAFFEEG